MIGSQLGAVVLAAVSMPLILLFSGGETPIARGYTITTAFFAVLAIPMFILIFFTSREVVKPVEEKKVSIRETIRVVLTNKPLICIFFILLIALTGYFGRMGAAVYYYIYALKRPDLIAPLMLLLPVFTTATMFVTKSYIDKIGKIRSIVIGCIASAVILFLIFLINPVTNIALLFVLTALFGIVLALPMPVLLALVPEAIDYMEDKTGVRADGTSYTAVTLSGKVASAIGIAICLTIMGVFGYEPNVDQAERSLMGINIAVNLFPSICFLLAVIPCALYGLTPEKNAEIRERLQKKAGL
jgi:GPH family glycoside/pentoside/hexuronide:cation symporter/probable glucitol transport protein GutA